METRSESSSKRARESHQDSNQNSSIEKYNKVPRLTSGDKAFFKELIKESEYITTEKIKYAIRESENTTSAVIKNSIMESEEKHFEYIKKLILESEERILSVMEIKISDLKNQMNSIIERVEQLEIKSIQIKEIEKEMVELKRKINKQENSVVASNIRITGIPFYENENLQTVFDNICNNIKIQTPRVDNIYRLKKIYKNNKAYNPKEETIVVKLHSPFEKNFLLKSISKFRRENRANLNLRHAGYESNVNIYVNEDLTPNNHKIFKAALNMKKSNQNIKSTFTLRGLVYVKMIDSDEPILVEFLEDLNKLFR